MFACIAFTSSVSVAQPSDSDASLAVADGFYFDGDYYRAIGEYQRFLFAYPDDPRRFSIELKIAWIYHVADRPVNATYELKRLETVTDDPRKSRWLNLYLADALFDTDPLLAKNRYESVYDSCASDDAECEELKTFAALGTARFHAARYDFNMASKSLRAVPEKSIHRATADDVAEYVDGLRIPRRSPFLAGVLSLVPGLGHFYLGEWGIGLVAMIWNGVFIYAAVDSVIAERYGQAALIGLLEFIWYGGTIFGAVSGAHRFNRDAKQIVADGMIKDIHQMRNDIPWAARFPAQYPTPLKLKLNF